MRVLVTGGAGFIGSHLCRALVARGDRVSVLDDLSTGRREAVPHGAELVVADVRDRGSVRRACRDADVVYHLAARVTIRGSVEHLRDDLDVNLGGTVTLLEALDGQSVRRVVNASSMAVYADSPSGAPVSESHEAMPLSPYGASKLAAEHYLRIVARGAGLEQVSLRLFNTYGPGQSKSPYVGVVTIFVTQLLAGESPTILGDGEQRRDFVHVDDVVAALLAASSAPLDGLPINVGSGVGTTVRELADRLIRELAPGVEPTFSDARAEELLCSVADITRARAILGHAPRQELELGAVIAHWREKLAAG